MNNYPDSKCYWGYMTICDACIPHAPKHVDTRKPINQVLPTIKCEICGVYKFSRIRKLTHDNPKP